MTAVGLHGDGAELRGINRVAACGLKADAPTSRSAAIVAADARAQRTLLWIPPARATLARLCGGITLFARDFCPRGIGCARVGDEVLLHAAFVVPSLVLQHPKSA